MHHYPTDNVTLLLFVSEISQISHKRNLKYPVLGQNKLQHEPGFVRLLKHVLRRRQLGQVTKSKLCKP